MENKFCIPKYIGILSIAFSSAFSSAQNNPVNAGFLVTRGEDTLNIESFTRSSTSLEGRMLVQNSIPVDYSAALTPFSTINKIEVKLLQGQEVIQKGTMIFKGDTIFTLSDKKGSETLDTLTSEKNALTYHPELPMISLLEQIVLRGMEIGGSKVAIPVFLMSTQGKTVTSEVNFMGKDSAEISLGNMEINLKLNDKGYILSGTTNNSQTITRIDSVPPSVFKKDPPDYSAPANAPYTAENVEIKTKAGHTLAGTLTIPKSAKGKVPVVVTITGSSPQNRDHSNPVSDKYKFYRRLADSLGREGVAVLRMDDRGIGASTGKFETATTADRADDIREGIEFVKKQKGIDADKIFFVGLSEGGLIAPMIAETNKNLKGMVLMAGPASTGREIMKYQVENTISQIDSLTTQERENLIEKKILEIEKETKNDPWLKYFMDSQPLETARKVSEVPVLILHGENDKNVPPAHAQKLAAAFKEAGNKKVEVKIFDGLNHIFVKDADGNPSNYYKLESFEVAPQVLSTIVGWIKDHVEL